MDSKKMINDNWYENTPAMLQAGAILEAGRLIAQSVDRAIREAMTRYLNSFKEERDNVCRYNQ